MIAGVCHHQFFISVSSIESTGTIYRRCVTLPNRGVNVGYDVWLDLYETGQTKHIDGKLNFPEGTTKLVLSGKGNYHPRQRFADKLAAADDRELGRQCNQYIWLSAYASNNNNSDYHWMVDACYYECKRRGQVKIYQRAYDQVVRENT
jgi:hypothetical protein